MLRYVFVVLTFLLAACLEVESTEVQVVADTKNDRLDLLIVSRGISSSAAGFQQLKQDLVELAGRGESRGIAWVGLAHALA